MPSPWQAKSPTEAVFHAATIRAHAEVVLELLDGDPAGVAPSGEPREVFARDTMAELDATVASLREALGVAPGFSGAEQ